MSDRVIPIQALVLRLHLRSGIDQLAKLSDLPFLIGHHFSIRGNVHINLAQLQLHTLIDGIGRHTRGCNRTLVAVSHGLELGLLTRPEIFELAARRDHVRMLVGEAQQQIIEARLRLADSARRIARAGRSTR